MKAKTLSLTDEGAKQEEKYEAYQTQFKEALGNDLNTSLMITVLYDVLKDDEVNNTTKKLLISDFDQVLSLDLFKEEEQTVDASLEKMILEKIEERKEAKKNKDFQKADQIRDELLGQGIKLIDTREGTTYEIVRD